MPKLLESEVREAEEAVKGLPAVVTETVSNVPALPGPEPDAATPIIGVASPTPHTEDLIQAAQDVAKDLLRCRSFHERLGVYNRVGREFKSEARRVLNIAAARWPEMIPTVNDLPEWKALLSGDLS